MNYLYLNSDAERAEEMIPSMSYTTLVGNLGWMTKLGLLAPGNPASMLVVARLVDRTRIQRSGMSADELRTVLRTYLTGTEWKPQYAVVKALEKAVETASENETQTAAHRPGRIGE